MSAAGKQPSRKAAFVDEVYRPNNEMHYKINAAKSAEELKTLYDAWAGDFDSWHDRVNGANIPAVELVKFLVHHVPPPLATRQDGCSTWVPVPEPRPSTSRSISRMTHPK